MIALKEYFEEPVEPQNETVMDEEDVRHRERREMMIEMMEFFDRGFFFVRSYADNELLAFHCLLLATGKYEVLGMDRQDRLAALHKVTKATVSDIVKAIQSEMNIEPMPSQASLGHCRNRAQAGKHQEVIAQIRG